MSDEKKLGQETGTPTGDDVKTGQEDADPQISDTDKILQAAEESEKPADSEEKSDDKGEGKEKPKPYDQDPKWKSLIWTIQ